MNKKISISIRSLLLIFLGIAGIVFFGSQITDEEEEYYIRDYDDIIKISSEIDIDTKNQVYQFRSVGAKPVTVKITPYKYRPYLNEFDELPPEIFTKEGYDNYLEFEMKPGDIQWREFTVAQVSVWKLKIEVMPLK